MYKKIVVEFGEQAFSLIDEHGLKDIPPVFHSTAKMMLKFIRGKLLGVSEADAEKIVVGAIDALDSLKRRIAVEPENKDG